MTRVLLPSDNFDFVANFAIGYRSLGIDATAGMINFELETDRFDIIHILWPEEFTGWVRPSASKVDAVLRRLDSWKARTRVIISVNNLLPHRDPNDPEFRRLYTGFYERADVIHHFSQTSKDLVCREFPSIANRNHVVRVGFNYERLLHQAPRIRADARSRFKFEADEFVFLTFGALRFWDEVVLLRHAFESAQIPKKRLLLAARYAEDGTPWRRRWRTWQWRRWQRSEKIETVPDRVPDEDLQNIFDAADAVIVLRQNTLSSGVPSLAMTLGRFVIAPDTGAMPEYLAGTNNLLYKSDSAGALARAMESAVVVDRERVGQENARIAKGWSWDAIVRCCLEGLAASKSDMAQVNNR